VSEDICTRILALPIHPDLTEEQLGRIAAAVRAAT
jgi:dTDP-4-amino-4,6-dideoxygalactose transaminase